MTAAPAPKRAAQYSRISQYDPRSGSMEEQDAYGKRIITQEGWVHAGAYRDEGESAFDGSLRQDWQRLMADIAKGRFDVIVVYEPARATRDRAVWAALAAACEEAGVHINASGRTYDPADPDEGFMLDLYFALARRESATTRKRVRRTAEARAKRGHPAAGTCAFGYRRMRDGNGVIVGQAPDDRPRVSIGEDGQEYSWSPAGIVRELFDRAQRGETLYALALDLTRRGIPNPRTLHGLENWTEEKRADRARRRKRQYGPEWMPMVVRQILHNDVYLGNRRHKGRLMKEGCWTPLVEPATFHEVVEGFVARRGMFPGGRPSRVRWLLSRLARCGHCGRLAQAMSYGPDASKVAYRCPVGGVHVPQEEADRYVTAALLGWLARPEMLESLSSADTMSEELALVRADLAAKRAELAQWNEDAIAGRADREVYIGRRAILLPEIEELERQARVAGVPLALHSLITDEGRSAWDELQLPAQRTALALVLEVELVPVGRTPTPPPIEERVRLTYKHLD